MGPSNHSKPPTPRSPSSDSLRGTDLFGPQAEAFLSAEGPVSDDIAHLLAAPLSLSKSRSHSRLRDVIGHQDDHVDEAGGEWSSERPNVALNGASNPHKSSSRPSPWWMLVITAFSSVVMT